jgi:choline dehydrogenase
MCAIIADPGLSHLGRSWNTWHPSRWTSISSTSSLLAQAPPEAFLQIGLSAHSENRVCLIEAGARGPSVSGPCTAWRHGADERPRGELVLVIGATAPRQRPRDFHAVRKGTRGGSSINGMVYMRGHAGDYDDWAAAGNRGWAYRDVLPYFLRSENNADWRDSPFHGTDGPLKVSDVRPRNPAVQSFIEAAKLLQIPESPDFNEPHPLGVGYRQATMRNGRRESTATAFLAPARTRRNLAIVTEALADKVRFEGKRAVGVRIRHQPA